MSDLGKDNKQSEEIDLLYLFRPVSQFIKKITGIITVYIKSLWLNKWIFLAIIAFSCALAFAVRMILPKGYRTEAIFASHRLNSGFCSLLINNLNESTGFNENFNLLSEQLKVKPETASDIISMVAFPLTDSLFMDRNDSTVSIFKIILTVHRKEAVEEIQSGLVNYLENNEYALRRKEARRKSLLALNEDFKIKLASLDSLKKLLNSSVVPRSTGQGIILGQPINPIDVYQTESTYYRYILKNNEDLNIENNIETLQSFLLPDNYNYPNFKKLFLVSLVSGVLVALIFSPSLGRKKRLTQ